MRKTPRSKSTTKITIFFSSPFLSKFAASIESSKTKRRRDILTHNNNNSMAISHRFLAVLLVLLSVGCASALIPPENLSPKAISDLRDGIVKRIGLGSEDKVLGFDARDALVGHAVKYEFGVLVDKKVMPIKLLGNVSNWDFVEVPIFKPAATATEEQEEKWPAERRRPDPRSSPALPPFQLAGPMKLLIRDGDDMRLSFPHDVEAGAVKTVVLSDGAVVTVKGARSVSLSNQIALPLPLNQSHQKDPDQPVASGLVTIAEALRHASRSSEKPLLSLRIVGPTSLASSPTAAPTNTLKLKRLAPGLVKLSSRNVPALPRNIVGGSRRRGSSTLWPLPSLNGSESQLLGFEKLLASVLGQSGSEKGYFMLVKAQVSAETYIKTDYAVERKLHEGEVDWSKYSSWRTRPEKVRHHFEVLARVGDDGKLIPEKITQVQPFVVSEPAIKWRWTLNEAPMSKTRVKEARPSSVYFTL